MEEQQRPQLSLFHRISRAVHERIQGPPRANSSVARPERIPTADGRRHLALVYIHHYPGPLSTGISLQFRVHIRVGKTRVCHRFVWGRHLAILLCPTTPELDSTSLGWNM
jgi:hypothetical protein